MSTNALDQKSFIEEFYKESSNNINSQVDTDDIKDIVYDYFDDCLYEISFYGSGFAALDISKIENREYTSIYESIWFNDNNDVFDLDYRYKSAFRTKESNGKRYSISRFVVSCPNSLNIEDFKSQVIDNILERIDIEYNGSIFSVKEQSPYVGKKDSKFYVFIFVPLN